MSLETSSINLAIRKLLNGDFVRHLVSEPEIWRHLGGHAFQIFPGGKCVVRGVHTDGLENLRVFAQAFALKAGLGNLAAILVPRRCVELIEPAFVFPTGRADVDAVLSKAGSSALDRGAVEWHE